MSGTKASPPFGRQLSSSRLNLPATQFTLRDLYVRASISGDSIAAELGRYLNIDATTFSSTLTENSKSNATNVESDVHERALAAIVEVVTTNATPISEYICTPGPRQGVQEWWAQMISGSVNNSKSATGCQAIGESL